jgi:uncharacterized damage-inducible protein DinB
VTKQHRPKLSLEPTAAPDPEIGRWLSALEDTRRRTLDALANLPEGLVDKAPTEVRSSIGTLLYHIAIVEADWLFDEILGTIESDWPADLFPVDMREEAGTLSPFTGETLEEHVARLATVRSMLIDVVRDMPVDTMHEVRERKNYDVTTGWVLHHLMQHEAEHRSQIGAVREALGAGLGW